MFALCLVVAVVVAVMVVVVVLIVSDVAWLTDWLCDAATSRARLWLVQPTVCGGSVLQPVWLLRYWCRVLWYDASRLAL